MFDASLPSLPTAFSRRRAILGMASAAAAVPACVTAAGPATVPHPDAELLDLGREWATSAARMDVLDRRLFEAQDRYVQPELPETLFCKSTDHRHLFGPERHFTTGRMWFGRSETIEWLRSAPLTTMSGDPDTAARTRRDAIVSAYDAWMVEDSRVSDECGLTAADAAQLAEIETNAALRRRIIELPARTLDGLLVKARVVSWCTGGLGEIERDLADDEFATNQTVSFSIARDLVAMLDAAVAA